MTAPARPGHLHEVEIAGPGMRVRGTTLFLDATRSTELSFVSHAHSDHVARHRQIIATAATLKLMALRLGGSCTGLPVPYGRPFAIGGLTLELLPAGHVLGSAQIRVTRGRRRLAYTGDLNTVPGLTAEPAQVAECDVLVIESTFGHPRYSLPPRERTYDEIRQFARTALREEAIPVLFTYALGKSQETVRLLSDGGLPAVVHSSIADVCEVYEQLGCPMKCRRYDGEVRAGEVVLFPMHLSRSRELAKLGATRTAALTGWALDHGAKFRFGTDEAFALSDHADFEGLLDYVRRTGASTVLTVHGFATELAACLRDRGIDAHPLVAPRQMELF